MYTTSIQAEKEKLEEAGVGLIGLKYGKRIVGATSAASTVALTAASAYEIICTYDCSEAEARAILGDDEDMEESEDAEESEDEASPVEPGRCIAITARGSQCKNKSVKGGQFCMAHSK